VLRRQLQGRPKPPRGQAMPRARAPLRALGKRSGRGRDLSHTTGQIRCSLRSGKGVTGRA
jgi:hypothetical protein